eukprot:2837282-Lingulodinium_polyedra.AAC.1
MAVQRSAVQCNAMATAVAWHGSAMHAWICAVLRRAAQCMALHPIACHGLAWHCVAWICCA